jgi:hypothetical protein
VSLFDFSVFLPRWLDRGFKFQPLFKPIFNPSLSYFAVLTLMILRPLGFVTGVPGVKLILKFRGLYFFSSKKIFVFNGDYKRKLFHFR